LIHGETMNSEARVRESEDPSIASRLVIAALAQLDRADAAERDTARIAYLSALENELLGSLEMGRTRETVAHVVVPELDAWTVVDVLEPNGVPSRLSVVYDAASQQEAVDVLNIDWIPREDDPIGYWAALREQGTLVVVDDIEAILARAAHSPEVLAALRTLKVSACLVVPMWNDNTEGQRTIDGAITFMSTRSRSHFTGAEIALAEQVARSCGRALRNTRMVESLNERRVAAERERQSTTDMLGHVTHELRTPLSAIGGYAELMQMGVRGPVTDEQNQDLQRIRWNQQHLLAIITQILSFVRAESGRTPFARIDIDLGTLLRESGEMLEPVIADKGHTVRLENCDAGGTIAVGDPDKVRQIAINLITNAVKYSPSRTEIVVRCVGNGARVFAEVQDAGAGVPAEKRESIFLPFVQLADGMADRQGGVGLGLAIARRLARAMEGDLTVDAGPAGGSIFRLALPGGGRARREGDARI
jgi:signal transduction histidine kinase